MIMYMAHAGEQRSKLHRELGHHGSSLLHSLPWVHAAELHLHWSSLPCEQILPADCVELLTTEFGRMISAFLRRCGNSSQLLGRPIERT